MRKTSVTTNLTKEKEYAKLKLRRKAHVPRPVNWKEINRVVWRHFILTRKCAFSLGVQVARRQPHIKAIEYVDH